MLKVEFHERGNVLTLRMEGRFVGEFATDVRDVFTKGKVASGLIVDVSEVSFVDAVGEEVLSWLGRIGALFLADTAYSSDVCKRLHLPLAKRVHHLSRAM